MTTENTSVNLTKTFLDKSHSNKEFLKH